MADIRAADLVHDWNGEAPVALTAITFEEDFRDTLQSVRVARPSTRERCRLVDLSAQTGVRLLFIGFPAVSAQERDQCVGVVRHLAATGSPAEPILMARVLQADLDAVKAVEQDAGSAVTVDLYISTSKLRAVVEGRPIDDQRARLRHVARQATRNGMTFRIAFEDSSRTSPAVLRDAVAEAAHLGACAVVLNDTVGAALPHGAATQVAFVRAIFQDAGVDLPIAWHGHNDTGLALANALAAVSAGASQVSGTFLGIGERTGNIPLEQLMWLAHEAGHPYVRPELLPGMCAAVGAALRIEVPPQQPLVGSDAFSTSTGTHAAAVTKASGLGADFEDLVYSAVKARSLGRTQEILLGPNSGRAAVEHVLRAQGHESSPETIAHVLLHCKRTMTVLRSREHLLSVIHRKSSDPDTARRGQGATTSEPAADMRRISDTDRSPDASRELPDTRPGPAASVIRRRSARRPGG